MLVLIWRALHGTLSYKCGGIVYLMHGLTRASGQINQQLHTFFFFIPVQEFPETLLSNNSLKQQIEGFVYNQVPAGHVFDAHSVIDFLIENHSDDYLGFYISQETTAQFHGRIS